MNPLRICAQNYRSYEAVDLEVPTGCLAVIGENGSGKSSLVNLVDLCLFGAQSRSLADYLREDALDEEMVLGLEFEHAGETYRVRRTFSGRGRGKSALDFERLDELADDHVEAWQPLTREDQKATQALIEQTIGLSRETFRASAFLAQGDGAAFTEAQPRERKAILGEVLGLGVWDVLLAKARAEATTIRDQTSRLAIQVEEAERELTERPSIEVRHQRAQGDAVQSSAALEKAEAAHKAATEDLNSSREHAAALEAAKTVLASREWDLAQAEQLRLSLHHAIEEAKSLPEQKALLEQNAARIPEIEEALAAARAGEKAREEHRRLTVERNRILGEASELNEKAQALRDKAHNHEVEVEGRPLPATCETCGQTLGEEARVTAIATWRSQADDFDATAKGKDRAAALIEPLIARAAEAMAPGPNAADQAELENELRLAHGSRTALAKVETLLENVEKVRVDLVEVDRRRPELETARVEASREVRDLTAKVGPLEEYEKAVARAYGVLHEARAQAEAAKRQLALAEAELHRLEGIATRVAENRTALASHQSELDLLALAERAYGKDGIPALIVENAAIPQIELEASRILAELGTSFRVELRTQREKKTGGVSDTLDIVICSPGGTRLYESLSGGERSRVNVALRIALARLLAHRRGAESRVLVLDEVEYLDESGQERLASVLRGLTGDFDTVILVSHVPGLRDVFDTTITVEKVDGRSQIAGQAELAETVAA